MSDVQEVTAQAEEKVTRLQKPRTMKIGKVVSDKMDKTVVIAVDYVRRHPLYHKRITRTSKFFAHDENNLAKPGDIVRIEETRPLSKRKRWVVREIVERAVQI
jgi:small subunit ribosomal protein S17